MSAPHCPSCGCSALRDRGRIPDAHGFAGSPLDQTLPGGRLYACTTCHLHFRSPRLGQEEMDRWYRAARPDSWALALSERRDCAIALRWIRASKAGGKVLDVGCFRGDFLAALGRPYEAHGIEINPAAAAAASDQGVQVVGRDFTDLGAQNAAFDVITAIDVLEHTPDPLVLLQALARALRPGGMAIISTGNTSAWTWRMMGGRYWYCANAEHIAFINPQWCRRAAATLGLELERLECFRYAGHPWRRSAVDALKNLSYFLVPGLVSWLRRRLHRAPGGAAPEDHPPAWATARDHLIVQFRRPDLPA